MPVLSTWWPEQLYYLLNCAALLPSPPMNPKNQQYNAFSKSVKLSKRHQD